MKGLIKKGINLLGYDIKRMKKQNQGEKELYEKLYNKDSLEKKAFYNIGAGSFNHKFWTNVDMDSEWYKNNRAYTLSGIQYDLFSLQPFPIEADTAEVVYTSHTLEHINNEAAQNMLNESYRILKKEGTLRLTTPNIDLLYRAYVDGDVSFYKPIFEMRKRQALNKRAPWEEWPIDFQPSIAQAFLSDFASSTCIYHREEENQFKIADDDFASLFKGMNYEDALDFCCLRCAIDIQKKYPGSHINWWNFNKFKRMLANAGFREESLFLSSYGQSSCPILRDLSLFDNTRPTMSLYIEVKK